MIRDAPAGDHLVTLRLGSREERLAAPVRPAETLALTYFFPRPAAPPPGGRRPESSRGASETPRGVREALDEALEAPRKALEKLRETLGRGGGSEAPRPAPPPGPSGSER